VRIIVLLLLCVLVLPAGAQSPKAAPLTLTFNPTNVTGGSEATGRLTISEPAPEGGLTVALSSNTPAAVVPARVVIPAGGTEVTFPVEASWVAKSTNVRIVASMVGRAYLSATGTLVLQPSGVTALTFDPPNVVGGQQTVGTVSISAPAPAAGLALQVEIVDPISPATPCSPPPTVPATVRVPPGSLRATFPIKTSPSWQEEYEIRVSTASTDARSTLRVTKPWLKDVKVPSRLKGGTTIDVVVELAGPALPPNCGVKHRLATSDPGVAQVPSDIVFPAGASEATFQMTTTKVPTPYGLTIIATALYFYTEDAYVEAKQVRIALTPW
jgi:hypothetical protein